MDACIVLCIGVRQSKSGCISLLWLLHQFESQHEAELLVLLTSEEIATSDLRSRRLMSTDWERLVTEEINCRK